MRGLDEKALARSGQDDLPATTATSRQAHGWEWSRITPEESMLLRRIGSRVLAWAPAKVNLFLEITHRRADGYHELQSLMVRVDVYDTLTLQDDPTGRLTLTCSDATLTTGPENLVLRAAELLRRKTGATPGARIHLEKRIPLEAGLAGGSTDAATTLAGLNTLWRLGRSVEQLAELGAEVGSDVPFFLSRNSAAWCTGRGEICEPLVLGRRLHLVLVHPGVGLSTAAVYRQVKIPAQPLTGEGIRRAAEAGDVRTLGRLLHNRLQEPAESLSPEVAHLRARLTALAPAGVLMSGSGSTVFALCSDAGECWRITQGLVRIREECPNLRVFSVRSCD